MTFELIDSDGNVLDSRDDLPEVVPPRLVERDKARGTWLKRIEASKPSPSGEDKVIVRGPRVIDEVAGTVSYGWTEEDKPFDPRAAMRATFEALPATVRGPFSPVMVGANDRLNQGDVEGAIELLKSTDVDPSLADVKQGFIDALTAMQE